MQRRILTHCMSSSRIPALQILLSYNTSSLESSQAYVDACAKLLEDMGVVRWRDNANDLLLSSVAECLTTMAQVLSDTDSVSYDPPFPNMR